MSAEEAKYEPLEPEPKAQASGVINVASDCTAGTPDSHLGTLPVYELGSYLNVSFNKRIHTKFE